MFQENISSNIDSLPEIDTERRAIHSVITFLDKYLPSFPSAFRLMTSSKAMEHEDLITQELCVYLERLARPNGIFMFQFQRKYPHSTRSSDIGIIEVENYNPTHPSKVFFVIEAKRLPTPGSGREREYVEGNHGGIERYKRGHHGKGLTDSAVIGYIQKHTCNHWFTQITSWINDLIRNSTASDILWDSSDLLIFEHDFITTKKYYSKNTRIVNSVSDSINLHHYLMEMSLSVNQSIKMPIIQKDGAVKSQP